MPYFKKFDYFNQILKIVSPLLCRSITFRFEFSKFPGLKGSRILEVPGKGKEEAMVPYCSVLLLVRTSLTYEKADIICNVV
jgi:hypothetical protein